MEPSGRPNLYRSKKSGIPGVNLHHTPLAVDNLAMRSHDPDKIQCCTGNSDVGMVSLRQKDSVAVAHHLNLRCTDSIRVDQLEPEARRRHVDEYVDLLQHRGMLVRRPTRPVAWQRSRNAHQQLAPLIITSHQDIVLSLRTSR